MMSKDRTPPSDDQTPQGILNAAADLIERTGWTQGFSALDSYGDSCYISSPAATCYCAYGAVIKSHADLGGGRGLLGPAFDIFRANAQTTDGVIDWNDQPGRTKEEVIAALRGASND